MGEARDWRRAKLSANNPIHGNIVAVPNIDTAEHDVLYQKFRVKRTHRGPVVRHHGHQWQCRCGRWHRVLKTPYTTKAQRIGDACPLCGDVPPTADNK